MAELPGVEQTQISTEWAIKSSLIEDLLPLLYV